MRYASVAGKILCRISVSRRDRPSCFSAGWATRVGAPCLSRCEQLTQARCHDVDATAEAAHRQLAGGHQAVRRGTANPKELRRARHREQKGQVIEYVVLQGNSPSFRMLKECVPGSTGPVNLRAALWTELGDFGSVGLCDSDSARMRVLAFTAPWHGRRTWVA